MPKGFHGMNVALCEIMLKFTKLNDLKKNGDSHFLSFLSWSVGGDFPLIIIYLLNKICIRVNKAVNKSPSQNCAQFPCCLGNAFLEGGLDVFGCDVRLISKENSARFSLPFFVVLLD